MQQFNQSSPWYAMFDEKILNCTRNADTFMSDPSKTKSCQIFQSRLCLSCDHIADKKDNSYILIWYNDNSNHRTLTDIDLGHF